VSSAAQRLAPAPAWFGQVELVLARAASEVRILSALTPCDARGERVRLTGELRAGRRAVPRWTYTRRPHDELRRALDEVQGVLERSDLTALEALYLDRARELALEAAMCASAGTRALAELATARFEPRDRRIARAGSALCAAWLEEPRPQPVEGTIASDSLDPTSLLSRMKTAVGRYRLPFSVVTSPWLAPLAATGERVILVTTGRLVPEEDAVRTVLHEIEGHARPRARSMQATSAHFRIGTARGIDDQEGRAILLEDRAGFLGPRRRKQLAARHWAVEAMLDGASFADVASALVSGQGLDAAEAVVVAERAFRGGDGTHPGLGRERVYLESMIRVGRHLAAHPEDDAVLASGQVAVSAADTLRPFMASPHRATEADHHREPETSGAP
jgi:hypothetical protein